MSFQVLVNKLGLQSHVRDWYVTIWTFRDELTREPEILGQALADEEPRVFAAAWRASGQSEPCRRAVLGALWENVLTANFSGGIESFRSLAVPELQIAYVAEAHRRLMELGADETFAARLSYVRLLGDPHPLIGAQDLPLLHAFLEECCRRGLAAWENDSSRVVELSLYTNAVLQDQLFELVLASPSRCRRLLNTSFGKLPCRQQSKLLKAAMADVSIAAEELASLHKHVQSVDERAELEYAVYERRCAEIDQMDSVDELGQALLGTESDKLGMRLRERILERVARFGRERPHELFMAIVVLGQESSSEAMIADLRQHARRRLTGN